MSLKVVRRLQAQCLTMVYINLDTQHCTQTRMVSLNMTTIWFSQQGSLGPY